MSPCVTAHGNLSEPGSRNPGKRRYQKLARYIREEAAVLFRRKESPGRKVFQELKRASGVEAMMKEKAAGLRGVDRLQAGWARARSPNHL